MTDEPDDYSTHEILHLTSVIARLIDTELAEHPRDEGPLTVAGSGLSDQF